MGNYMWLAVPAIAGLIGLFLVVSGIGSFVAKRAMIGSLKSVFGLVALGFGALSALGGFNLMQYKPLIEERPVARLVFAGTDEVDVYEATIDYADDAARDETHRLRGNEFNFSAEVLSFKPAAVLKGADSLYRVVAISSYDDEDVGEDVSMSRWKLAEADDTFPNLFAMWNERQDKDEKIINSVGGKAVFAPMADGLEYHVCITQTALELRPANSAAARALGNRFQVEPPEDACRE